MNCVDLPPEERDKIICLYPEEECEQTSVASEFGDHDASISPELAVYAMLICTPLQFIFELMCVFLAKTRSKYFFHINHIVTDPNNTWESFKLLAFQIFVAGVYVYIIAQSAYFIEIVASEGRPGLIFLTLLLSIIFD